MKSSVVTIGVLLSVIVILGIAIQIYPYVSKSFTSNAINSPPKQNTPVILNRPTGQITGQVTNEPNETIWPTWSSNAIRFKFVDESACSPHESVRIRNAFNNIQQASTNAITFVEDNASDQITISCTSKYADNIDESEGKFAAAITKTSILGNTIQSASITFYHITPDSIASNCGTYPDTEVHEILHAFGFIHTSERFHIMNPTQLYCPTKINNDIIVKLRELYP